MASTGRERLWIRRSSGCSITPTLVLFCGNNEDFKMVLRWGDVKKFPAIKIYEEMLPDVVGAVTCMCRTTVARLTAGRGKEFPQ
ncbi:hypothetical protein B0H11DRAFT_2220163 [Mycena galericulata]|nr:hypothetical protein B0H11DRAFT_2220163 [Mycena galericulata]